MFELSVLQKLPKVELHLHLDGCIPVESAWEMLRDMNAQEPYGGLSLAELRQLMVVETPLNSQKELLEYFRVPTQVLQTRGNLRRAYYELCAMKKKDYVCYCEVRFAPQLHTMGGLTLDEIMCAVLEGKRQGEADFGIFTNIIIVGLKHKSVDENIEMLEVMKKYRDCGVVAVDVAGTEAGAHISEQQSFLLRARKLGFKVTFHCGEIQKSLDDLIKMTHDIVPDRIAHGAIAAASPKFCRELAEKNIMLDICPTSNIQAGLYSGYREVPLKKLCKSGVPVSISTDDTVLSDVTLSEELNLVFLNLDLSIDNLINLNFKALEHSFADKTVKEILYNKINSFLEGEGK